MNRIIYSTAFMFSIFCCFSQHREKILKGKHWAGGCNSTNCDTMSFKAHKKYDSNYYQWGKCAEGWDFVNDSVVQKYYNVLCSSESDPKSLFTSQWKLHGDTLEMDSYNMNEKYFIVSLSRSELKVKLIKYFAKELQAKDLPPPEK